MNRKTAAIFYAIALFDLFVSSLQLLSYITMEACSRNANFLDSLKEKVVIVTGELKFGAE
jgi:hypothetical protein